MDNRIGIIGARGHVGAELVSLLEAHPKFELALVSSREFAGNPVARHVDGYQGKLCYSDPRADELAGHGLDAIVLALPNDKSVKYVSVFDDYVGIAPIIVDLSADHRFDDNWYYGLPELTRGSYDGHRRISNPGCYATAMQLAIAPMRDVLLGPVQCFGVSGYSGAGTTPSDNNNPDMLHDNLIPYALTGHLHEHEVSRHLQRDVEFMPHVAPHFRGLTITANLHLAHEFDSIQVSARYHEFYASEPLVRISDEAPWVSHVAGKHGVVIGGFRLASGGRRLVVVAALDNLLKGAATQALQNLNLAFGWGELIGIPDVGKER